MDVVHLGKTQRFAMCCQVCGIVALKVAVFAVEGGNFVSICIVDMVWALYDSSLP